MSLTFVWEVWLVHGRLQDQYALICSHNGLGNLNDLQRPRVNIEKSHFTKENLSRSVEGSTHNTSSTLMKQVITNQIGAKYHCCDLKQPQNQILDSRCAQQISDYFHKKLISASMTRLSILFLTPRCSLVVQVSDAYW